MKQLIATVIEDTIPSKEPHYNVYLSLFVFGTLIMYIMSLIFHMISIIIYMLRSLILLAFSVTSIYYSNLYTRRKLHISSPDTLVYFNAVQLMNNALAEATDLD